MNRGSLKDTTAETDILIGSRIRHFRQAHGLSQTDLASAIGVTFQQMQKYEKGQNRISTSALILICKTLGITPNDVIGQFFEGAEVSVAGQLAEENAALKSTLSEIRRIAA
ncbi:helix-turn-helix domain-containing protein [Sinorhizobium fredii]|uniref:helix-turn-helix domain-containing protein n=1 Tax=Rhizobium fredii TaxID=380 RepID=UPI0004AC5DD7|nr:helix-turn-helix transcriptional regulator [Sinorhizobium fredii]